MKQKQLEWMALLGFLGLVLFLILRTGWLSPPAEFPKSFALLLLVGPLMFPLRGMLHGRHYTYGWSMFLALLYFVVGVVYAASPENRWHGFLVIGLSAMWFFGCMLFLREKGKQREAAGLEKPTRAKDHQP